MSGLIWKKGLLPLVLVDLLFSSFDFWSYAFHPNTMEAFLIRLKPDLMDFAFSLYPY